MRSDFKKECKCFPEQFQKHDAEHVHTNMPAMCYKKKKQ